MKLKFAIQSVAASLLVAPAAFSDGHMADSMTLVSWGGAYQQSQESAYTIPYAKMKPVEVIWEEASAEAVARLRAMNEANNITWDVVDVIPSAAIRLCDEGLILEIDHDAALEPAPDGTPPTEDFGEIIVSPCFIPQIVYSTTFGYRTDMVPAGTEPPTGACDVFDLEKYPGKRALEKRPIANMEWALLCAGVAYEDVYDALETEEGLQQAFDKLDTIKDQTIWWSAGAETPQLLADGEIFMGSTYNGRLFELIEVQGQPVGMAWNWQMFDLDGWAIPVGLSPEREARAFDFVRFATDTQRLADQSKYISYGPARKSSAALVSTHAELGIEMGPHMPTDPNNAENTFLFNYVWWADNRDDIDERFQAWLSR